MPPETKQEQETLQPPQHQSRPPGLESEMDPLPRVHRHRVPRGQ